MIALWALSHITTTHSSLYSTTMDNLLLPLNREGDRSAGETVVRKSSARSNSRRWRGAGFVVEGLHSIHEDRGSDDVCGLTGVRVC